jgi:hypothetical protein
MIWSSGDRKVQNAISVARTSYNMKKAEGVIARRPSTFIPALAVKTADVIGARVGGSKLLFCWVPAV